MAPRSNKVDDDGAGSKFTQGELEFATAYFANMTSKPDMNWDTLAAHLGMKDAKSVIRRSCKFFARHGPAAQSGGNSAATPGKATVDGDAVAGSSPVADKATRVTKKRAPPKKKVAVKEEAKGVKEEIGEDEDAI